MKIGMMSNLEEKEAKLSPQPTREQGEVRTVSTHDLLVCVCVCVSSVCAQTKMCENFPLTFLNFKLVKQQKIIFLIAVALNRCVEAGEMPVGGSEV